MDRLQKLFCALTAVAHSRCRSRQYSCSRPCCLFIWTRTHAGSLVASHDVCMYVSPRSLVVKEKDKADNNGGGRVNRIYVMVHSRGLFPLALLSSSTASIMVLDNVQIQQHGVVHPSIRLLGQEISELHPWKPANMQLSTFPFQPSFSHHSAPFFSYAKRSVSPDSSLSLPSSLGHR